MTSQSLIEDLLLLWVDGPTGRFKQTDLRYALAGAATAELLLNRRLRLMAQQLYVHLAEPLGDEAIDCAFHLFRVSDRPRKVSWWIRNFYPSARQPLDIAAGRLIERGALTRRDHVALWVIHWTDYPVLEPALVEQLRRRVRNAILQGSEPDERTAILISILHQSGRMDAVLDAEERVAHERRIAAICALNEFGYLVGKAIAEVRREDREMQQRAHNRIIVIDDRTRKRRRRRTGPPSFPGTPPKDNEPWSLQETDS